jgi:hypothetical protein
LLLDIDQELYRWNITQITLLKAFCSTPIFHTDRFYGASIGALNAVTEEFGYKLISAEPGLDAFFIRTSILKGCEVPLYWSNSSSSVKVMHQAANSAKDAHGVLMDYYLWR